MIALVGGMHRDCQSFSHLGRPREEIRCVIEKEPVRQCGAIRQGGAEHQVIVRIAVGKGVRIQRDVQRFPLHARLVGERVDQGGRIRTFFDGEHKTVRYARAMAVGGGYLDLDGADVRLMGCTGEGARIGIKMQPVRPRFGAFAPCNPDGIVQRVALVPLQKGILGPLKPKRLVLLGRRYHLLGDGTVLDGGRIPGHHVEFKKIRRRGARRVAGRDVDGEGLPGVRLPGEGARLRIKPKPGGQGGAIGLMGGQGDTIVEEGIGIRKAIGGNPEREGGGLHDLPIWQRRGALGRVIMVQNGQADDAMACHLLGIGCRHLNQQMAHVVVRRCTMQPTALRIQGKPRWKGGFARRGCHGKVPRSIAGPLQEGRLGESVGEGGIFHGYGNVDLTLSRHRVVGR